MKRIAAALVLAAFAGAAGADLYRWVDPETGSVKYSSYPPPWYNEAAPDRRAPKVERIPQATPPVPVAPRSSGVTAVDALEDQRRALLLMLSATAALENTPAAQAEFKRQLELYQQVSSQLDRLDPAGSAVRKTDLQRLAEKLNHPAPPLPSK